MFKANKLKHILLTLILILGTLSTYANPSTQTPDSADAPTPQSWLLDFYGESYKSITQKASVLFDRWRLSKPQLFLPNGNLEFSIEHFNFGTTLQYPHQTLVSLTAGYSLQFNRYFKLMISARAENISSPASHGWSLRSGFLGGTFAPIGEQGLFYETYYEAYLESLTNPYVKNNFFAMSSAWAKLGWRWDQIKRPLFFDPLILEGRIYRNNSPTLAGDNYSLLNIGPRILFYKENPNFSISLFGGRSFGLDQQTKKLAEPTWFVLSFGGQF